jgi:ferredoxin--NADP+ reductase
MTDAVAPVEADALQPTGSLSVETVLSVRHWNEHLFSFRITRPSSFRFRSGEVVMIRLPGENGKPLLRAYSVASPPRCSTVSASPRTPTPNPANM